MMNDTRGHSNIYQGSTRRYKTCPDRARVSIMGGGRVDTVKRLPDLSLSKEDWLQIGRAMGWTEE